MGVSASELRRACRLLMEVEVRLKALAQGKREVLCEAADVVFEAGPDDELRRACDVLEGFVRGYDAGELREIAGDMRSAAEAALKVAVFCEGEESV